MKKFARLILSLLACSIFLTSCSQSGSQGSLSSGSSSSVQSLSSVSEDLKSKVTLKWLGSYASYDPNSEYAAKILEEETGYKVEYNLLPSENANQRLSLEISSGNHYDILKLSLAQYAMLAGQGALLALDPYLDAHPSIKENTDARGWYSVKQADGKTYGIPEVGTTQLSGSLGYRSDIFEEYGWKEPNTVDEFYQLLKNIKEKTGKIPLTGNQYLQETILSGFGVDKYAFEINNGKVQSFLRNPGTRQYLEYMNKLYTEGLIDVDWPVNKGENITQKMSTGDAIMSHMSWTATPTWVRALQETVPEAGFKSILPLEDSEGKRHIDPNSGSVIINVIAIPKNSAENADLAVGMVEARLEKEVWWSFNAGTEGVHYSLSDQGVPIPIQPKYKEDMTNGNYFQTSVNVTQHPITWLSRVAKDEILYDAWYEMNLKSLDYDYIYDPFAFSSFEAYDKYNAALAQKTNDYFLKVIAGTEPVSSYDDFLRSWEQAGGLEYEQGAQEWYDSNQDIVKLALEAKPSYLDLFKK